MSEKQELERRKAAETMLTFSEQRNQELKENFQSLVLILSQHPDFKAVAAPTYEQTLENARRIVEKKFGPVDGQYILIPGDESTVVEFEEADQNTEIFIPKV